MSCDENIFYHYDSGIAGITGLKCEEYIHWMEETWLFKSDIYFLFIHFLFQIYLYRIKSI